MAEALTTNPEQPGAEAAWDLRALRLVRIHLTVWAILRLLVGLLVAGVISWARAWVWSPIALALLANGVFRVWLAWWFWRDDFPRRVEVLPNGLWIERERSQSLASWAEIEGFAGVLRQTPGLTAPRLTTGGLSRSLRLKAGGRWVGLSTPVSSGDLEAVVDAIEKKLLERQGKA